MTAVSAVFLLLLLVVAVQFALAVRTGVRRIDLRHQFRTEQTRAHFAEIRNDLWALVREGKLSIDSQAFRRFHVLATAVVRRPDEYARIAEVAGVALINARTKPQQEPRPDDPIAVEALMWSPEVRAIAERLCVGIVLLARNHSWQFRFADAIIRRTELLAARSVALRQEAERRRAQAEARALDRAGFSGYQRQLRGYCAMAVTAVALTASSPTASAGPSSAGPVRARNAADIRPPE